MSKQRLAFAISDSVAHPGVIVKNSATGEIVYDIRFGSRDGEIVVREVRGDAVMFESDASNQVSIRQRGLLKYSKESKK